MIRGRNDQRVGSEPCCIECRQHLPHCPIKFPHRSVKIGHIAASGGNIRHGSWRLNGAPIILGFGLAIFSVSLKVSHRQPERLLGSSFAEIEPPPA